jgi:hypothetical protein
MTCGARASVPSIAVPHRGRHWNRQRILRNGFSYLIAAPIDAALVFMQVKQCSAEQNAQSVSKMRLGGTP